MTIAACLPILVVSHPRSGTHLMIDVLRRNFPDAGGRKRWLEPNDALYINLERLSNPPRQMSKKRFNDLLSRSPSPILKTHFNAAFNQSWIERESIAPPEFAEPVITAAKVIYVVRDPRAVFQSFHQFMSGLHPELYDLNLDGFAHQQLWTGESRWEHWKRHWKGWSDNPDVLQVSFEKLIDQPDFVLETLESFLNFPARAKSPRLPSKLASITRSRLNRLVGTNPASTAILADQARFPTKSWRDHMSPDLAHEMSEYYQSQRAHQKREKGEHACL